MAKRNILLKELTTKHARQSFIKMTDSCALSHIFLRVVIVLVITATNGLKY